MLVAVWIGFLLFVVIMVALDLGVFHRHAHEVSMVEALAWTLTWVALALAFNVLIYFMYGENWLGWSDLHAHDLTGREAAIQFFTGYLVEKSLSVDNIFVIALIFSYFGVPRREQHRVLVWGVLGALVFRGIMIAGGAVLIAKFDWITYVFGIILFVTAGRLLLSSAESIHPDRNLFVRVARKLYPVTSDFRGSDFFARLDDGRLALTPLFLALLLVETSDVLFAVDSIPAIFAITRDPFLVFTSNVFAILGLRSLFFVLAGLIHHFRFLKITLVLILGYVGVKIGISNHFHIPNVLSLCVIAGLLACGVLASIFIPPPSPVPAPVAPLAAKIERLTRLSLRPARRLVIIVVGLTVLLAGVAMLVIPGPGLIVIPFALVVLLLEATWAWRWLKRIREDAAEAGRRLAIRLGLLAPEGSGPPPDDETPAPGSEE